MRIATPDLRQEEQLHQSGLAVINLFASDLFTYIDKKLEKAEGTDWLANYRLKSFNYKNYNFIDPSNLLKELLRVSQSPLRAPLREAVKPQELVAFFDRLQIILDDRNDWVHRNLDFTPESLKGLVANIYPVARELNLQVSVECDHLLVNLKNVETDVLAEGISQPGVVTSGNTGNEIVDFIPLITREEPSIGELTTEKLSGHSYVLQIDGEIRDRSTGTFLVSVRPESGPKVGFFLLARKPNGGRMRMTTSGNLIAYFEDHWGYLAKIPGDYWFPNHCS